MSNSLANAYVVSDYPVAIDLYRCVDGAVLYLKGFSPSFIREVSKLFVTKSIEHNRVGDTFALVIDDAFANIINTLNCTDFLNLVRSMIQHKINYVDVTDVLFNCKTSISEWEEFCSLYVYEDEKSLYPYIKNFATANAKVSNSVYTLVGYQDGVVLNATVSLKTSMVIRKSLNCSMTAMSEDGLMYTFAWKAKGPFIRALILDIIDNMRIIDPTYDEYVQTVILLDKPADRLPVTLIHCTKNFDELLKGYE